MASMSLSKAMKVKNRLAGRLAKTVQTIQVYNSVVEGRVGEVDVHSLDVKRAALVAALVELKTAISMASRDIQRDLYEIAEMKSEIDFLTNLNTRHGEETSGYQPTTQKWVATIQMKEVSDRVKSLEGTIDSLQDKIDHFNSSPDRCVVSDKVLELAS